jgi:hypothetical protein
MFRDYSLLWGRVVRLEEFDDLLKAACPSSQNTVFAVLLAGFPPDFSIRHASGKGSGILEKYLNSISSIDLRDATNAPQKYAEAKVLFVFVGLTASGTIRDYRKRWYGKFGSEAERVFGRGYNHKQLLSLLPHTELQIQLTLDLDSKTVTDVKLSKRLEARIHSVNVLRSAMEEASRLNSSGFSRGW